MAHVGKQRQGWLTEELWTARPACPGHGHPREINVLDGRQCGPGPADHRGVRAGCDCSGDRLRRSWPAVLERCAKAPSPQVTFRVTPELKARAAAEAERQGPCISDVAREALERYLAS